MIDERWPMQRLWVGTTAVLFFGFERTVGQSLPIWFAGLVMMVGVGCLMSARLAVQTLRLEAETHRR